MSHRRPIALVIKFVCIRCHIRRPIGVNIVRDLHRDFVDLLHIDDDDDVGDDENDANVGNVDSDDD